MVLPLPRGILFDFGNTLLREGPVDQRAGASAVLHKARERNGCTVDRLVTATRAVMTELERHRTATRTEPPPETIWKQVYEPLGLRFDATREEIEWTYWSAATSWAPEPGVLEMLKLLRARGIPAGVVSNTMFRGEVIARQLAICGLMDELAWVIASADVTYRKPHPKIYAQAIARMDLAPADLWFVGDNWEYDVCGPAHAGMTGFWYRGGNGDPPPDRRAAAVIDSWDEFGGYLDGALVP